MFYKGYFEKDGECEMCGDGTFKEKYGNQPCTECLSGEISNSDRTGCQACMTGQTEECILYKCGEGTFNNGLLYNDTIRCDKCTPSSGPHEGLEFQIECLENQDTTIFSYPVNESTTEGGRYVLITPKTENRMWPWSVLYASLLCATTCAIMSRSSSTLSLDFI